ncbi:MAG: hypothetical protein H6704_31215 [Myxococcales bacterium]|nr:hypothetical protein [Myxococcales bacterium]
MHVVALRSLPSPEPDRVKALADILGLTAYEARSRLMAPAGGPTVLGQQAEAEAAAAMAQALRAAGFEPLVLDAARVETDARRFVVRRFRLTDAAIEATNRAGEQQAVPYGTVRLALQATGISVETTTETTKSRTFSAGRALATGGLMMSRTQKTTTTRTSEDWSGCLFVYGAGPTLAFREPELAYDAADGPVLPTRHANFARLASTVKARCPGAVWDDRLVRRASQTQILGPTLPPEDNLDVALALVARALRG